MQCARGVWSDEAVSLTIEWPVSLFDRLSLDGFEAFKSLPRRGLEIGGLLLGSVRTSAGHTTISIEDYQPVPSEHRFGPSYVLSQADLASFDESFAHHPQAVGMYRTDTHSNTLILQKDIEPVFQRHFATRESILLLLHPASRKAAFCRNTGGRLSLVHKFPIHMAGLPQPLEAAGPENTPAAAPLPGPAPQPTPPARPKKPQGKIWAVRAAAVIIGGVLGAFTWQLVEPRWPGTRPAAPAGSATGVPLQISRAGHMVFLAWDREAAAIAGASHAILHVRDGNHKIDLPLTAAELGSGRFSYWPATPDPTFRLDTFRTPPKSANPVPVAAAQPANPVAVSAPLPTPPRSATARLAEAPPIAKEPAEDRPPTGPETATASRAEVEASRPPAVAPSPKPAPAPASAPVTSVPSTAAPLKTSLEPRIEVSAVPSPASRWRRTLRRIPLLRRLRKQPQATVPPQPIHEAKPSLSAAERRDLITEVPIDVRVYITETGKVDYAELLDTKYASRHRELADDAVFTARHWSFSPARIGDEDVASEMILHFVFKPPDEIRP